MTSVSTDRRFGVTGSVAIKTPCKTATTANITLSGEQTIDGVACTSGDRVLVKDQTTASENGIYEVNTSDWRREPDFDGSRDVVEGTLVFSTDGSTTKGYWRVTTSDPIVPGTTSLAFEAADVDSVLRNDLASTTNGAGKGFHLVYIERTDAEVSAGIIPVNYEYEPGHIQRYGAVVDNVTDDSTAINNAFLASDEIIFPDGVTYIGGTSLQLRSDLKIKGLGSAYIRSDGTVPIFVGSASEFLSRIYIDNLILDKGTYGIDMAQAHRVRVTNIDIRDMSVCSISHATGEQNFYENITIRNNNVACTYGIVVADETVSSLTITPDPVRGAWFDRSRILNIHMESTQPTVSISTGMSTGNDIADCTIQNVSMMQMSNVGLVTGTVQYSTISTFVFDNVGTKRTDTSNKLVYLGDITGSTIENMFLQTNCVYKYGIYIANIATISTIKNSTASGDNVADFGFYVASATGYNFILENCQGTLYVDNVDQYKIDQVNIIKCAFTINNVNASHSFANFSDQDINFALALNNLGTSVPTSAINFKVARGSSSQTIMAIKETGVEIGYFAWDSRPLKLGSNHYIWLNGNDLRGSIGAPTSATDGTLIATLT